MILFLDADRIEALVTPRDLIDAIAAAFRENIVAPERHVVSVPGGEGDRLLLLMPAYFADGSGAVKLTTVFPDNKAAASPTIQGAILVFTACGTPMALLEGASVTRLRTAAASALAARYLARIDSRRLLLVGTGALAPYLAAAHASVRPIETVTIWGRSADKIADTIKRTRTLLPSWVNVTATDNLQAAAGKAHIISCATAVKEPLLRGAWLKPGTHIDLVGSFSPERRECDDDTIRTARLFVDTFAGAMAEAGDILQPLARGIIEEEDLCGELADLVCRRVHGRSSEDEVTLFKSVGSAIEDLAAARLILVQANYNSSIA